MRRRMWRALQLRLLRLPVSTCRWRPDDDGFARVQDRRGTAREWFDSSIQSLHGILPHLSGFAARQAKGPDAAVAGEDGAIHPLQEPNRSANAVAGIPSAAPARALADVKILQ